MCEGKEEDYKEVTIVELKLKNKGKDRQMERSSGRNDGRVDKSSVKDEVVLAVCARRKGHTRRKRAMVA